MLAVGKTDIGAKRSSNQDSIYINNGPIGSLPNLFIVADGMGGHNAGDFASSYAINVVTDYVASSDIQSPISLLKRAMIFANSEVYRQSMEDVGKSGMGTTMVAAVVKDNELFVANIGDSRLYIVNEDINQITMDHSLVEELIRSGQLKRNNGRNHPEKNIITKAMGSKDEVIPDFFETEVKPGDKLLLCSDGLSNMVENDEIRDIIREHDDIEEATDILIERANYYGGLDNISIVLVSI